VIRTERGGNVSIERDISCWRRSSIAGTPIGSFAFVVVSSLSALGWLQHGGISRERTLLKSSRSELSVELICEARYQDFPSRAVLADVLGDQGELPSSAALPPQGRFIGEEWSTGSTSWVWMQPAGASLPSWVDP
jgi:hypothetical protein